MTLRAVAWDIDGTLVDSEPLHHHALVSVSAKYGLEIDPDDQSFVGVHIGHVWEQLRPQFPVAVEERTWHEEIRAFYAEHSESLVPIPGAVETVKALAESGIAQICVSNSDRTVVDVNLRSLGIADIMVGSISLDDVPAGKPDPAPYRMAAEALDLPPHEVLAVEDSITGMQSALAAGLKIAFLGNTVLGGPPRADFYPTSPSEIPEFLDLNHTGDAGDFNS
ncbi:HAD family hydrolase [Roseibium marinum]|uniref:HAD superfamily hydrolase (TIGR01509 family)/HAD superfamily hydrolase (TIGR01549 family) n=1 Tax=Roseibium marinum TaxID=281252 RepID=A0A2S3UMY9_9HYPH|nr:HAD family phosphatase [Roseibium marinum]POF28923.1 HAD superfamily hydrolase (TIGR01509 family)/HAD superfamily hydrolase (TIGR01549 family) [Roseibium marinum]